MGPLDRVATGGGGISLHYLFAFPSVMWKLSTPSLEGTHTHTYFCHDYYKIPLAVYIFHIQLYLLPYAMTAL